VQLKKENNFKQSIFNKPATIIKKTNK